MIIQACMHASFPQVTLFPHIRSILNSKDTQLFIIRRKKFKKNKKSPLPLSHPRSLYSFPLRLYPSTSPSNPHSLLPLSLFLSHSIFLLAPLSVSLSLSLSVCPSTLSLPLSLFPSSSLSLSLCLPSLPFSFCPPLPHHGTFPLPLPLSSLILASLHSNLSPSSHPSFCPSLSAPHSPPSSLASASLPVSSTLSLPPSPPLLPLRSLSFPLPSFTFCLSVVRAHVLSCCLQGE